MSEPFPISVLVTALGGQGGGVLVDFLMAAAEAAGFPAQATSIPGVSQRTGSTTYYFEVSPVPRRELGGRQPVFGLAPLPGRLDLLVSSELLETVRQIGNGMASRERTVVVSSTARSLTTLERMPVGDGRRDAAQMIAAVQANSRHHCLVDMPELAREASAMLSSVMLGCIAATGVLPFERGAYEAAIGEGGGGSQADRRGFALGFDAARRASARAAEPPRGAAAAAAAVAPDGGSDLPSVAADLAAFPPALRGRVAAGHARVVEYQDAAYGGLYSKRLRTLLAAEQAADPEATQQYEATHEAARWLALWMAFDDVVQVARLKSRASRLQRVRGEVKAGASDIVKVYDYFTPSIAEVAALLPERFAGLLTRWDRARVARGLRPWSVPLQLGAHTIAGTLALRALASLRRLRRYGHRYGVEQAMIGAWLDGIVAGLAVSPRLGLEVARCGRLIKGYGATNEQGKATLRQVLELIGSRSESGAEARAAAVAAAREAALSATCGGADAPPRAPAPPLIREIRDVRRRAAS